MIIDVSANLLQYMCTNNYSNKKVLTKLLQK